ncbi:MAG: VWA domain-containing protein [Hyphomicrobium sp.]|nr:VWA domain-containing protein [Hyphomicrobium sp.]
MSKIRTAALVIALSASFLPAPGGAAELKLEADLGQTVLSASKPGNVYLRLSLKSLAAGKREKRTPVNAAIVIDRSGSMQGERIAAAKEGARVALKRLSSDDTVALIAYNHEVDVLSPAAPLRNSRDKLLEAIDRLHADGTTALYDGVKEGGRQVEEYVSDNNVNRVILLSDGLANVGPSTPGELAELGRKLASKGISVSTIGLGLDYNEDLMQRLAAASDGNHVFVERPSDLAEIFDREFGDALSVSARDITIIIECRAGFTPKRILGRDGSVDGNKVTLKLNQLQAENERYVVVELEAPEGAPKVPPMSLTYRSPTSTSTTAASRRAPRPSPACASPPMPRRSRTASTSR